MRSLKEYNPTPMTDKQGRPNPSLEGNRFRIQALELVVIGFLLALSFSILLS